MQSQLIQQKSLIPEGVSASLQELQGLRYLAWPFMRSQNKSRAQLAGKHRSLQKSRGMEFDEVRQYQPGDDVRTIDWRVTARTQTPHTKYFQEEKEKAVITLVDQRSPMLFGSSHCFKSVTACYLAALHNWASLESGDRSGGILLGHQGINEIRPARSHRTINRWLQTLCEANHALLDSEHQSIDFARLQQRPPAFTEALQHLKNSARQNAEILFISDFSDLDKHSDALLYALSKRHQLAFYQIVDPLEIAFPLTGYTAFSNGQQQQQLMIDRQVQQQLQLNRQEKSQQLQALCRRYRIRLYTVRTDHDLLKPMGAGLV